MTPDAFGVYVHVPFCARRCDYCAFATWTDRGHLQAAYAAACRAEIERSELRPATSVFFGGGTPSLLDPGLLTAILGDIPRQSAAEVTVECNPDTVTPALLEAYAGAGVNRLSFGVQSMVPHVLRSLGRTHDPGAATRAVALARQAGFASFNLDLIFGAAGESLDDWRSTLDAVLALDPPHVSAYALTVEPGTPLAADATRHPDDDDQADKYLVAEEVLVAAGLASYEISNWAVAGHECRHNVLYWTGDDYRGIGCAAHSSVGGRRWWNVRTPERYIALVGAGASTIAGDERLDDAARRLELLQLALRTREGVPTDALDLADERLDGLVEVDRSGTRVRLSVRGRLLANEVALLVR
ncbi:MAG TPA: radical SAM family heme chaperone HemW [Acidimicrobiales bacterium]|nr:radical SAM family heme chaperone HemW [Acidimicrobiales bacterium]